MHGPLRGCGILVLISRGIITLPKKATIGGIICIGDDYYGLTTAHAFNEVEQTDSSSDDDFKFAFYGLDYMMTSRGSISPISSTSPNLDVLGNVLSYPLTLKELLTLPRRKTLRLIRLSASLGLFS